MASTQGAAFDQSRLPREQGCKLSTDQQRMGFVYTVRDYMEFARSCPEKLASWNEKEGVATMNLFIKAVCSGDNWPLACQAVPEFRRPFPATADANVNDQQGLLLPSIFKGVRHKLPLPRKITLPDASVSEEHQNWLKWQAHLKYVGYIGGLVDMSPPGRQGEVEAVRGQLANALDQVADGQPAPDPTTRPRKHRYTLPSENDQAQRS